MRNEPHFTPAQLRNHFDFLLYKDLIPVITEPEKLYTVAELQSFIEEFAGKEEEVC